MILCHSDHNENIFKQCFKCKQSKPLEDFYKHPGMKDGRLNKCKECARRDVIRNREDKHEYYILYDRQRYETPERQAQHKYRRGVIKMLSGDARIEFNRKRNEWHKKHHAVKKAANLRVRRAIIAGKLVKQPCTQCNSSDDVEAHHPDYTKPLEVVWLCTKCHGLTHRKSRV